MTRRMVARGGERSQEIRTQRRCLCTLQDTEKNRSEGLQQHRGEVLHNRGVQITLIDGIRGSFSENCIRDQGNGGNNNRELGPNSYGCINPPRLDHKLHRVRMGTVNDQGRTPWN